MDLEQAVEKMLDEYYASVFIGSNPLLEAIEEVAKAFGYEGKHPSLAKNVNKEW